MSQSEETNTKLTRRNALRAGAVAAASAAGGLSLSTQPAQSHPGLVPVAAAASKYTGAATAGGAATILASRGYSALWGDENNYDTVNKIGFHASLLREQIGSDIDEDHFEDLHRYNSDAADTHRINQAIIEVAAESDDYDTAEDAGEAAYDIVMDEIASQQEWALNGYYSHVKEFTRALGDIDVLSDVDESDILEAYGTSGSWSSGTNPPWEIEYLDLEGDVTVHHELLNGDTVEYTTSYVNFRVSGSNSDGTLTAAAYLADEHGLDTFTIDGTDGHIGCPISDHPDSPDENLRIPRPMSLSENTDRDPRDHDRKEAVDESFGRIGVGDFPYEEYEDLDDDEKEDIEKPPQEIDDEQVLLLSPMHWIMILQNIRETASDTAADAEQFVVDHWDDIEDDDIDLEEVLTPSQLAEMTNDQNSFAYSSQAARFSGTGGVAETTELKFHYEDEDGEDHEIVQSGSIRSFPSLSSGFDVGEEYDPDDLDAQIYFDFQDDDGNQRTTKLRRPFEVKNTWTVDADGDLVEQDSTTFSDGTNLSPPDNYSELQEYIDDLSETEQNAETVQVEIAADQDGSGGLPDLDDVPRWVQIVIVASGAGWLLSQ